MKVINPLGRRNLVFGSAILGLLMLSMITLAFGGLVTVSGPCTGTTNISNTNYVFTGSCTGTISTSETMTTTSQIGNLLQVYNPSCVPLGIPDVVNEINANFTGTANFIESDIVHNYTAIVFLNTTARIVGESVYQNGIRLLAFDFNQSLPTSWVLIPGEHWDVYADDGGQVFLYNPGQTQILFSLNMPNYPSDFHATAVANLVLSRNSTDTTMQLGQQFNTPTDVPITHSIGGPCSTAFANSMVGIPQTFLTNWNNSTEIIATISQ